MNRPCFLIAVTLSHLLAWLAPAHAQQSPHVGYVFPAGGRQGTEFEVRVGGQFLDGVAAAHISGPGIQVKVVELVKPMTQSRPINCATSSRPCSSGRPLAPPHWVSWAGKQGKQVGQQARCVAGKHGALVGGGKADDPRYPQEAGEVL